MTLGSNTICRPRRQQIGINGLGQLARSPV